MYIINIQPINSQISPFCISCDNNRVYDVLLLLEDSSKVKSYKINYDGIHLNAEALKYQFSGYLSPVGKAVAEFVW